MAFLTLQRVDLSAGTVSLSAAGVAVRITTAHATNPLRLPASPVDNDEISVVNDDGGGTAAIVQDGSGTPLVTLTDGDERTFKYDATGVDWAIF